jgi:hypothetical protein
MPSCSTFLAIATGLVRAPTILTVRSGTLSQFDAGSMAAQITATGKGLGPSENLTFEVGATPGGAILQSG